MLHRDTAIAGIPMYIGTDGHGCFVIHKTNRIHLPVESLPKGQVWVERRLSVFVSANSPRDRSVSCRRHPVGTVSQWCGWHPDRSELVKLCCPDCFSANTAGQASRATHRTNLDGSLSPAWVIPAAMDADGFMDAGNLRATVREDRTDGCAKEPVVTDDIAGCRR